MVKHKMFCQRSSDFGGQNKIHPYYQENLTFMYECKFSNLQTFSRGGGLVTKSCLTLGDPMDCSLQGSSVHGILTHSRQKFQRQESLF